MTLKWARWAACVWSCFRPPEANLSSCKRFAYVMRHVWGDYMVTLHIGEWLQLLFDLRWRVWKWSSNYGQVEQISNCKLFSGGKWLLRLIYWLGVKIPERYWSWGVMWWRSNIAWLEVSNYLPNGVMVFRKTFLEPYILGTEVKYIKDLWSFVPYSWRSGIWRISWAKISNFFCGGNWDKIFWEINSLPYWIL